MTKGDPSPWKQGGKRRRREASIDALVDGWRVRDAARRGRNPPSLLRDLRHTAADDGPLTRVYLNKRELALLLEVLGEETDLLTRYDRKMSPLALKAEGRLRRARALAASLPKD